MDDVITETQQRSYGFATCYFWSYWYHVPGSKSAILVLTFDWKADASKNGLEEYLDLSGTKHTSFKDQLFEALQSAFCGPKAVVDHKNFGFKLWECETKTSKDGVTYVVDNYICVEFTTWADDGISALESQLVENALRKMLTIHEAHLPMAYDEAESGDDLESDFSDWGKLSEAFCEGANLSGGTLTLLD